MEYSIHEAEITKENARFGSPKTETYFHSITCDRCEWSSDSARPKALAEFNRHWEMNHHAPRTEWRTVNDINGDLKLYRIAGPVKHRIVTSHGHIKASDVIG